MGRGDNRRARKTLQRKSQKKRKLRIKKKIVAAKQAARA